MASSFVPNSAGLREFLLSSDLYKPLDAAAQPVLARARSNASQHVDTGDYLRSIHLERDRAPSRVRVRVVADDRVAPILEARYHVLGRAAG